MVQCHIVNAGQTRFPGLDAAIHGARPDPAFRHHFSRHSLEGQRAKRALAEFLSVVRFYGGAPIAKHLALPSSTQLGRVLRMANTTTFAGSNVAFRPDAICR